MTILIMWDDEPFLHTFIETAHDDDVYVSFLTDSLCSLDEVDSRSQIQLDESNSSLDIFYANTRSSTSPTKLYRELILFYDLNENTEEACEDILRRNIRLWKIGSQGQDLSEE